LALRQILETTGVASVQELSASTPTANLLTGLGIDEYFKQHPSGNSFSVPCRRSHWRSS